MIPPQFLVIAGANGSGKSTLAATVIPPNFTFLNADEIAKQLVETPSSNKDILAGRMLLTEWNRLEAQRADFAVETTLASRSLAPRIARLQSIGYQCHLVFVWLPTVDLAVARVASRVRLGGHGIPEATIRRRYKAGLVNFFSLYQPLVDTWRVYDNTQAKLPELIASGQHDVLLQLYNPEIWQRIKEAVADG